jgi:anti-anti-sigma factor
VAKRARANRIAGVDGRRRQTGAGFECLLARSGDAVVASLRGELDLAGARVLDESLRAVIDDRPERVVIDLRGLVFMGSAGLHAISMLRHRLGAHSQLVLVRGPECVQRVFAISGLGETLHFVDAADAGVELAHEEGQGSS